jgi:hypothetical protein
VFGLYIGGYITYSGGMSHLILEDELSPTPWKIYSVNIHGLSTFGNKIP